MVEKHRFDLQTLSFWASKSTPSIAEFEAFQEWFLPYRFHLPHWQGNFEVDDYPKK
jgi:hypothetical protein